MLNLCSFSRNPSDVGLSHQRDKGTAEKGFIYNAVTNDSTQIYTGEACRDQPLDAAS